MFFNDGRLSTADDLAEIADGMTCTPVMVDATTVSAPLVHGSDSETSGTVAANGSERRISARVLVVEDDPAGRQMLLRILHKRGYEVAGAPDASVAGDLLQHQRFHLVITDLGMPGDSGLDLIGALSDRTPSVATILVTGAGSTHVASQALGLGAYGYLSKPYLPDEVYIAVLNALRRQELELQSLKSREFLEETVRRRTMELCDSLVQLQIAQQELQDKARQLEALDAMKTQFIQLVSHELQTPLTVIKGGVQTVLRYGERIEPELHKQLLGSVHKNAEQLGRMIQKILVAGAIRQRGLDSDQGPFRLDLVAAEALSEVSVHPSPRVARDLPQVIAVGDRNLIREAVRDLIENALLHTDGNVKISTQQGGSVAALTVTDEGPAPSEDLVSRLFAEPFVQADSSTTRAAGGLGLSLYLAKRIVEGSSGRLTVERVGRGSAFSITLPTPMDALQSPVSRQGGRGR